MFIYDPNEPMQEIEFILKKTHELSFPVFTIDVDLFQHQTNVECIHTLLALSTNLRQLHVALQNLQCLHLYNYKCTNFKQ